MSHSLEKLQAELEQDLVIDRANIQSAAVSNPVIYGKWIRYKADLCRQRIGLNSAHVVTLRDSLMHLTGRGEDISMFEFSATELRTVIPAEDAVLASSKKMDYIDVMIKFCEGAIESVRQRGFSIRAIVDHQALMAGIK